MLEIYANYLSAQEKSNTVTSININFLLIPRYTHLSLVTIYYNMWDIRAPFDFI